MNCRRFQHRLYEYLDGTLSRGAQAAAERHLSGCAACRQALQAERQIAQSLSDQFRRTTDSLQLPPEVQRRVLAALAEQSRAPSEEKGSVFAWGRLAWPLGLAASMSLLLAGVFFFARGPKWQTAPAQPHLAEGEVSIQFSYVVPIYTFRREGGYVIDALTYQTNVVNERLPAQLARLE
ncbi:MAG: zf-HC2 domain-containing protein [Verrucomicrobiota bacterium]|jgi:anti-sigma factor RsiW